MKGEKIDIVKWHEDDAEFIKEALSPATAISVNILDPLEKVCRVIVPDNQLSLAIGNRGQNAKLSAKLTGYKIDIRSESETDDEEPLFTEKPQQPVSMEAEEITE